MSDGGAALAAVLDVGKTHVKLLVLADDGSVVAERRRPNAPVASAHCYPALDTDGIADWLCDTLAGLGSSVRRQLASIVATTHGAAFAALCGDALAMPLPDYEFAGFDAGRPGWRQQLDPFAATLSPLLPRGLNVATQLDWLQSQAQTAFAAADTLLPYPQFWAWWLCGVRASELSSLGCHTQLWRPLERRCSDLARRRGWAARLPPLAPAWQPLAPLRPALARRLGLPSTVRVHCGAHDSNACLARHLQTRPRLTLVSSGTWTVVMAPGGDAAAVDGTPDLLGNVSVHGAVVPTGRFMGGRELLALAAGADPLAADDAALDALLARGVMALPAFETQGGPFAGSAGEVVGDGGAVIDAALLPARQRAALAQLYCADVTAWLVRRLRAPAPVVVEGPAAASAVYMQALAAMLPDGGVAGGDDALDGTARGAWQLTRWAAGGGSADSAVAAPCRQLPARPLSAAIRRHHAAWCALADRRVTPAS